MSCWEWRRTGQVDVQIVALDVAGSCANDARVRRVEDWCGGGVEEADLVNGARCEAWACERYACGAEGEAEGGHFGEVVWVGR